MIKSLTITNPKGENLVLSMGDPKTSGFSIRGITGLGPPKAEINMTEVLTLDGGYYNSSRVSYRNVVLTLGFEPGIIDNVYNTVEDLRLKLYRYFPIKKQINLMIETDNRTVHIEGRIESNEPNIFSKDSTTNISIICPAAYFHNATDDLSEFSYISSLFSFPFSNESLVNPLLNMGSIVIQYEKSIVYGGDADTGIVLRIHALGTIEDLLIYNATTEESMFINTTILNALTGHPIINNDEIVISTVKGNKFIYLVRQGVPVNILPCLANTSTWFQLVPGDNLFNYSATSGVSNVLLSVEFNTLYEGI
jgi:hypothetical protein